MAELIVHESEKVVKLWYVEEYYGAGNLMYYVVGFPDGMWLQCTYCCDGDECRHVEAVRSNLIGGTHG